MKNLKSQVFTVAHKIKNQFETFGQALKAAWKIVKLKFKMSNEVTFAKSSGEVRIATVKAILNLDTVAKGFVRFIEQLPNGDTQFRSFRVERLI